jgi:hypothetical protein
MKCRAKKEIENAKTLSCRTVYPQPKASAQCNIPEHCAIPFRGLVPLSPFKERGKERIRKASPFLLSSFFFGYGLFLLLLGFFHIPSAFSSHCLFSSLYFGIDYSCSPYSLIMDKKASCLKRWVLCLTCHFGKSL